MNVEIINTNLSLNIHGFSGTAINKDYAGTAFKLMDRMWKIVKGNNLENKGLNIWVIQKCLNDITMKKTLALSVLIFFLCVQVYAQTLSKRQAKKWFAKKEWLAGAKLSLHQTISTE